MGTPSVLDLSALLTDDAPSASSKRVRDLIEEFEEKARIPRPTVNPRNACLTVSLARPEEHNSARSLTITFDSATDLCFTARSANNEVYQFNAQAITPATARYKIHIEPITSSTTEGSLHEDEEPSIDRVLGPLKSHLSSDDNEDTSPRLFASRQLAEMVGVPQRQGESVLETLMRSHTVLQSQTPFGGPVSEDSTGEESSEEEEAAFMPNRDSDDDRPLLLIDENAIVKTREAAISSEEFDHYAAIKRHESLKLDHAYKNQDSPRVYTHRSVHTNSHGSVHTHSHGSVHTHSVHTHSHGSVHTNSQLHGSVHSECSPRRNEYVPSRAEECSPRSSSESEAKRPSKTHLALEEAARYDADEVVTQSPSSNAGPFWSQHLRRTVSSTWPPSEAVSLHGRDTKSDDQPEDFFRYSQRPAPVKMTRARKRREQRKRRREKLRSELSSLPPNPTHKRKFNGNISGYLHNRGAVIVANFEQAHRDSVDEIFHRLKHTHYRPYVLHLTNTLVEETIKNRRN